MRRNGFWFSLGFGFAIVLLTTGCFALTEAALGLLYQEEKGVTQVDDRTTDMVDNETPEVDANEPEGEVERRSDTELVVAAVAVDLSIMRDALTIPPELFIHLPAIKELLKELKDFRANLQRPCVGHDDFKEDMFALREQLSETKAQTMAVINTHLIFADKPMIECGKIAPASLSEMKANIMLAFRHLENARMRFGKAIQAFDGGESCYKR